MDNSSATRRHRTPDQILGPTSQPGKHKHRLDKSI